MKCSTCNTNHCKAKRDTFMPTPPASKDCGHCTWWIVKEEKHHGYCAWHYQYNPDLGSEGPLFTDHVFLLEEMEEMGFLYYSPWVNWNPLHGPAFMEGNCFCGESLSDEHNFPFLADHVRTVYPIEYALHILDQLVVDERPGKGVSKKVRDVSKGQLSSGPGICFLRNHPYRGWIAPEVYPANEVLSDWSVHLHVGDLVPQVKLNGRWTLTDPIGDDFTNGILPARWFATPDAGEQAYQIENFLNGTHFKEGESFKKVLPKKDEDGNTIRNEAGFPIKELQDTIGRGMVEKFSVNWNVVKNPKLDQLGRIVPLEGRKIVETKSGPALLKSSFTLTSVTVDHAHDRYLDADLLICRASVEDNQDHSSNPICKGVKAKKIGNKRDGYPTLREESPCTNHSVDDSGFCWSHGGKVAKTTHQCTDSTNDGLTCARHWSKRAEIHALYPEDASRSEVQWRQLNDHEALYHLTFPRSDSPLYSSGEWETLYGKDMRQFSRPWSIRSGVKRYSPGDAHSHTVNILPITQQGTIAHILSDKPWNHSGETVSVPHRTCDWAKYAYTMKDLIKVDRTHSHDNNYYQRNPDHLMEHIKSSHGDEAPAVDWKHGSEWQSEVPSVQGHYKDSKEVDHASRIQFPVGRDWRSPDGRTYLELIRDADIVMCMEEGIKKMLSIWNEGWVVYSFGSVTLYGDPDYERFVKEYIIPGGKWIGLHVDSDIRSNAGVKLHTKLHFSQLIAWGVDPSRIIVVAPPEPGGIKLGYDDYRRYYQEEGWGMAACLTFAFEPQYSTQDLLDLFEENRSLYKDTSISPSMLVLGARKLSFLANEKGVIPSVGAETLARHMGAKDFNTAKRVLEVLTKVGFWTTLDDSEPELLEHAAFGEGMGWKKTPGFRIDARFRTAHHLEDFRLDERIVPFPSPQR